MQNDLAGGNKMNMQFLNSKQKKEILRELEKEFGVLDIPYILIESGKEKIRGFSGNISKDEIIELSKLTNIEVIGLYLIKREKAGLRLSLDGTQVLKDKISKGIIEINDMQAKEWMQGKDLPISSSGDYKVIKFNSDYLGCGKSTGSAILNHVPKDRRIKK